MDIGQVYRYPGTRYGNQSEPHAIFIPTSIRNPCSEHSSKYKDTNINPVYIIHRKI